jgi:hypothetical protein
MALPVALLSSFRIASFTSIPPGQSRPLRGYREVSTVKRCGQPGLGYEIADRGFREVESDHESAVPFNHEALDVGGAGGELEP